jgi:hypothetical protein
MAHEQSQSKLVIECRGGRMRVRDTPGDRESTKPHPLIPERLRVTQICCRPPHHSDSNDSPIPQEYEPAEPHLHPQDGGIVPNIPLDVEEQKPEHFRQAAANLKAWLVTERDHSEALVQQYIANEAKSTQRIKDIKTKAQTDADPQSTDPKISDELHTARESFEQNTREHEQHSNALALTEGRLRWLEIMYPEN